MADAAPCDDGTAPSAALQRVEALCQDGDGLLLRKHSIVAARFEASLSELRIPTLDRMLYRRYLIERKSHDTLQQLVALTRTLSEHRHRTLDVLAAIREREAVLERLGRYVATVRSTAAESVEVRLAVSKRLYSLQQATLRTVDAVRHWRGLLTRPHAFVFRGQNYLLKVLRDNRVLAESALHAVIPVRIAEYGLCSDLPSLALFRETDGARSTPSSPRHQGRLRRAEAYLAAEFETQLALVRELIGLCVSGFFVPLLSTPVVPRCGEGVRMNNAVWEQRLAKALRRTYEDLTRPPPLPEGWKQLVLRDQDIDGYSEPLSDEFRGTEGSDAADNDGASDSFSDR
eukprot:TRINITY_DN42903_c0_g1_i1.p1 TRINITY_DN42903_c0_g1~~TRINITY_DN42903_c0_g1_i1.p1  ORF type:complete len:363 (+),score=97.95 TRINITY_DN42903_c0_g1_i1:59-1090(+)